MEKCEAARIARVMRVQPPSTLLGKTDADPRPESIAITCSPAGTPLVGMIALLLPGSPRRGGVMEQPHQGPSG
jgi:hypothetical protein